MYVSFPRLLIIEDSSLNLLISAYPHPPGAFPPRLGIWVCSCYKPPAFRRDTELPPEMFPQYTPLKAHRPVTPSPPYSPKIIVARYILCVVIIYCVSTLQVLSSVILATLSGVCFAPFTEEKTQARQWQKSYIHPSSLGQHRILRETVGEERKREERIKEW